MLDDQLKQEAGEALLDPDAPPIKATNARWWILLVYCLLAVCQACSWNIYSPIYPAVYMAFPSWTPTYMNWLINSANISFGLSLYPISRAISWFGPRKVTLFAAVMVLIGAMLRCLPIPDGQTQQIVQVVAMLCNGAGGTWLKFGGPIVSDLWFPSEERTTATAIASVATYTGAALGFVVGPAAVGSPSTQSEARRAINHLFYIEAAVCFLCAIMCISYFPNRPDYPPSEAALAKREAEKSAFDKARNEDIVETSENETSEENNIVGNDAQPPEGVAPYFAWNSNTLKYWVISLCMALPLGMFQGWNSTMFSCLKPLDVTENEASW